MGAMSERDAPTVLSLASAVTTTSQTGSGPRSAGKAHPLDSVDPNHRVRMLSQHSQCSRRTPNTSS